MLGRVSGISLVVAASGGCLLLAPDDPRLLAASGFLGLFLLCEALERVGPDRTPLRAGLVGLVFGSAANAVALFSLVELLGAFAHLPLPLALLVALLAWLAQGMLFATACWLSTLAERGSTPRWLTLPLALTVVLGLGPAIFPWHVAATQVGFLPFVQLADLGGESLVGLFLTTAACATHALLRANKRSRARLLVLIACTIGVPVSYGVARLATIRALRAEAPALLLGVAQSSVGMKQKHDEASRHDNLEGLRSLTRALEREGAELTVWGETAYPYHLLRNAERAPDDVRRVLGDGVHGPVLLGLETYEGPDASAPKYNSAWLLRADGSLGERVDKTRLLAFGEYIPFWDLLPPIRARFASQGFARGAPGTIRTDQGPLGVLICYEDLFASSARATVLLGARALVNLTNDAWFGDTREPLLHDVLARMRAIELRRDLVRAVNTGVSSFTSATGEVLVQTHTFERAHFVATVRLLDEQTLYARVGDWVWPCCLVLLCGSIWRRRLRPTTGARSSVGSAD